MSEYTFTVTENLEGYVSRIAQEFADAETFDDWTPPDGPHSALIIGFKDGSGKSGTWMQLRCQCLDPNPDLTDKEFSIWFRESAPAGILKSAANAISGRKIEDSREAVEIIGKSVGLTVNLKVTTNEKGFKNIRIIDVVPDVK